VGFEPTIRFPVYTLSKRAPSATRPSLRGRRRNIVEVGGLTTHAGNLDCRTIRPPPPCRSPPAPAAPRGHGLQRTAVMLISASMPLRPVTKSPSRRSDCRPACRPRRQGTGRSPPQAQSPSRQENGSSIGPAPTQASGKADFYGRSVNIIKNLSDQKIMPADGLVAHRQDLRLNGQTTRHIESY
jgi:hypothetical protein